MAAKDWFLLLFIVLISNTIVTAQGIESPEFFFGSYIANRYFERNQIPDSIWQQIKDCGLNAVQEYARKDQYPNLQKLSEFSFVYASNDSAHHLTIDSSNDDWINYFTHAKYYRWEAEGDEYFPADQGTVGIKHEFGHSTTGGWSSGTDTGYIGEKLIYGPNYTQYKNYVYTDREIGLPIQYIAKFRMKTVEPPENAVDAAKIKVVIKNIETNTDSTLDSLIISSSDLSTEYRDFYLTYNYDSLQHEGLENTPDYPFAIGSDWVPFEGDTAASWIDFNLKVHFVVEWLGGAELIVDYIEVYDGDEKGIWEKYFLQYPDSINYYISTYLQEFQSVNPTFYSKLKYFTTIDEPHSWDSFIPIREIQKILDSLNSGKSLLVHFYPGWDNKRDGVDDVLEKWVSIAEPKKLMFWYGPFTNDQNFIPHPRSFTLFYLRMIMQRAHELKPDFFLTPQAFSDYNTVTGQYDRYMYPTERELGASTLLGLAHGAKGFNYEMYFSYMNGILEK